MQQPRRNSYGSTAPITPSELPQGYAQPTIQAVRVVNGFTATLPGRSRLFFQRIYFAPMPVPLVSAPGSPFPKPIDIATIQAPTHQGIVLRSASFKVYQHSGIGVDDFVEVPPSRTASYFGFQLRIGNRGLTDFNTNLVPSPGAGPIVPVIAPNGGPTAAIAAGQGTGQIFPYSGPSTPVGDSTFASYVRPGDQMVAKAFLLRLPNYDVRFFSVEMQGWLANETEIDRMVNMLSG